MSSSQESRPVSDAERGSSWLRQAARKAEALVANPLFAYTAIIALQLRVIWKVWDYRDVTSGDTAGYFLVAVTWANELRDNIVWSPLYTNVLGSFVALIGDVPSAVMAHRIAIVMAATVLILALMRSLLGPALGLLAAVWWAIVPANFDVEYEVHLFGLLPVLVAAVILSRAQSRLAIGVAFSIFVGSTLLLRNELAIATAAFAVVIAIREIRDRREEPPPIHAYVRAYGVPLLIVFVLAGGAYWRSFVRGDEALAVLRVKHELNMCQVFAFNFQQRHPRKFKGNPFTDCRPLMERTFGRPLPSFTHALRANPGAVGDFVGWNARLFPAGIQVALFGATSDGVTPGYFPVKRHRAYALALSVLLLIVVIAGLATASAERPLWQREWLRRHAWEIAVLAATGATSVVVALTQRPRAEYVYALTIVLMVVTGLSVSALLRRLGWLRAAGTAAAATAIGLCVAMPSYYHKTSRPIHDGLGRLDAVRHRLQRPDSVLVTTGYGFEFCAYLAVRFDRYCTSPNWSDLEKQIGAGAPVQVALERAKATVLYADPLMHTNPNVARFLKSPAQAGWREVERGVGTDGQWSVLVRNS